MNILIISDQPESKLFGQVLTLKKEIQELDRNKVDLIIFSQKGIFLNQEKIEKRADMAHNFLKSLLNERMYGVIAISLEISNLKNLFSEKRSILDFMKDISPQTATFVFGASSVLGKLKKEKTIHFFLYSRPGVSKLTKKFKNDVIAYIKTKQLE